MFHPGSEPEPGSFSLSQSVVCGPPVVHGRPHSGQRVDNTNHISNFEISVFKIARESVFLELSRLRIHLIGYFLMLLSHQHLIATLHVVLGAISSQVVRECVFMGEVVL